MSLYINQPYLYKWWQIYTNGVPQPKSNKSQSVGKIYQRGWLRWQISCFDFGGGGSLSGGEMYIMQIARITVATLRGTFGSLLRPPIYPQKKSEPSSFKVLSMEFITGSWVGIRIWQLNSFGKSWRKKITKSTYSVWGDHPPTPTRIKLLLDSNVL